MKVTSKQSKRERRHRRVRMKVKGTKEIPRLSVFRSSKHLVLQLTDDGAGRTLLGLNDYKIKKGTKSERAQSLGTQASKKILALGLKKIVFDRAGYKYHGRIQVLAGALRKGGVKF